MGSIESPLPQRLAQPTLPKSISVKVARDPELRRALEAYDANLRRYLDAQQRMIDRAWGDLVASLALFARGGTLANRPVASIKWRTYFVTDSVPPMLSIDDGSAWHTANFT